MTHKQTLYSLRTDGDQFRITKIVDGEVESSYLCTTHECECPAGHRPSCRHRQMIPDMLARGITDTHWFWNFDTHRVVDFNGELKSNIDALNELAAEAAGPPPEPKSFLAKWTDVINAPVGETQHTEPTEHKPEIERQLDRMMGADADAQASLEKALRPSWRRL